MDIPFFKYGLKDVEKDISYTTGKENTISCVLACTR